MNVPNTMLVNEKRRNPFFIYAIPMVLLFCFCSKFSMAQNCSINAGGDQTICLGKPLQLEGNIGGPFNTSTIVWSVVSQPAGSAVVIATPRSFITNITNVTLTGTYTFRLSGTCGDGITTSDVVTVNVVAVPALPAQSGTNNFSCYTGTPITISGTAPLAGETILWYTTGGLGTFSAPNSSTTNFTPVFPADECLSSTEIDIVYKITNAAGCERSVSRTYTFSRSYSFYALADPTPVCGNSTLLKGSCAGTGTSLWSVVSTPAGAPAPVLSNANSRLSVASNLVPGTYVFNYAVSGSACGNNSANVTVVVASGTGVSQAYAGEDQRYCNVPGTISLSGSKPAVGETGTWTLSQGGTSVSIASPTNYNTTVSGLTNAGAPYTFLYTITTPGGCSTKDSVTIWGTPELTLTNTGPVSTCVSLNLPYAYAGIRNAQLGYFAYNQIDTLTVTTTYISGPAPDVSVVTSMGSSVNSNIHTNAPEPKLQIGQTSTVKYYNTGSLSGTYELYMPAFGAGAGGPRDSYSYYVVTYLDSMTLVGTYKYSVTYATRCSTYTAEMTVARGLTATVNAGSDLYLGCNVTSATLAGNLLDNFGTWQTVSRPAGASDPINTSNFYQRNPSLTGLIPGTYVFRYSNVAGQCTQASDEVKLVVASVLPPTPNAGADQTICAGTYRLNATAVPATALAQWTVVSPAGAAITFSDPTVANPTISGLLPNTTYRFRYTLTNGCGTSFDDIVLTTGANTGPEKPVITTSSFTACSIQTSISYPYTTGSLITHPALTGTQTGTLTVVAVPAGALTSYTVTSSTATTKTVSITVNNDAAVSYIWCVSDPNCAAQTFCDTLTRFFNFNGSTIDAGPDQNICSVSSFPFTTTLTGTTTGVPKQWSLIYSSNGQSVSFGTPLSNTTTVTLPAAGTYKFMYQLTGTDPNCPKMDYVTLVVSSPGSLAQAGPDLSVCNSTGVVNLAATPLAVGTGRWTIEDVIAGALPVIADPTSPTTTITFPQSGTVVLRWSSYATNSVCGVTSSDLVTVTYTAPARAGSDISLCGNTSTNLDAVNPDPATGTWSQLSGPNTATIANSANPNTLITNLVTGTYTFRWTVSRDGLCVTSDNVTVTINSIPAAANAGADFAACNGSTNNKILLNATAAPVGQTGTWVLISRPAGAAMGTFSNINDPKAIYTGATTAGTYVFSWTLSNGVCSTTDFITVTVDPSTCITISGEVFDDPNGNTRIDGTEGSLTIPANLYVYLVNSSGAIVDSARVRSDGTYTLNASPNTSYTIELSTVQYSPGNNIAVTPIDNAVPSGWVTVGENGAGNSGPGDGLANGVLPVTTGTINVTQQNFAIEQLPNSDPKTQFVPYPNGGIIPAGTATTAVSGSDPEDGILGNSNTFVVTKLPANATMYYNGSLVTLNQQITNFNPALLSFTGITNGSVDVIFEYAFLDAAGKRDPTPATYTLTWANIFPLPVTLESFTGRAILCDKIDLTWKISSATNFSHFEVERSVDGSSYQKVGTVIYDPAMTGYSFSEINLPVGRYQYRLKLVDADGRSKYSHIANVKLDCNQVQIQAYPNPAKDMLTVSGLKAGEQIALYSAAGQKLQIRNVTGYQERLDISGYAAGLYYLLVSDMDGVSVFQQKIIKLK